MTENSHVQAASVQLQADEILAELFTCVETFGSATLVNGQHGLMALPYFERDNEPGHYYDEGYIEACHDDSGDGFLLRYRKLYGATQCFYVTWINANKVC